MSKSKVFCFLSCFLLLVVLVLPSSASPSPDDSLILTYPVSPPSQPFSIPTSYFLFYDVVVGGTTTSLPVSPSPYGTVSSSLYTTVRGYSSSSVSGNVYTNVFFGYGITSNIPAGSLVTLSYSGLSPVLLTTLETSTQPDFSSPSVSFSDTLPVGSSTYTLPASQVQWYLYDLSYNILAGPFTGDSGDVPFVFSSDVQGLIFGFEFHSREYGGAGTRRYATRQLTVPNSTASLSLSVDLSGTVEGLITQTNELVSQGNSSLAHIDSDMHTVITILQDFSSTIVSDPMAQFEGRYIEMMQDQLNGVEDMLSSSNPALPNGGDFVGFADDMQKGFGVNGSSFSASDFSSAAGSFSGSSSTAEGGPWEFFSQGVADSLAGGASSIGLDDDDYIYAWLEQSERRYGLWASSSP